VLAFVRGEGAYLWRGSLLPLACEAAPKPGGAVRQLNRIRCFTTAAQPSGSKLPRHKMELVADLR